MPQAIPISTTSRRRLLARDTLAAPALAVPAVALADTAEPDPHPAWARQAEAVIARLSTPGLVDDEDAPELADEVCRLDDLMCYTRARTLAGVREQLVSVTRALVHSQPGEAEDAAIANALATIERLAGEVDHV